jgi:uncharacterized protein YjiS (DUF1127 family)
MVLVVDRESVMASRFQGKRVLIAHLAWSQSPCVFLRDIAFRFRRWREDQQTWAALRHLDDRQLKEFGIYPRPPELTRRKFP